MRTNVYVHGFNLYYGCLKGTRYRWLDLETLCERLLPRHQIQRLRYFTARVAARPNKPHDPGINPPTSVGLPGLPSGASRAGQVQLGRPARKGRRGHATVANAMTSGFTQMSSRDNCVEEFARNHD